MTDLSNKFIDDKLSQTLESSFILGEPNNMNFGVRVRGGKYVSFSEASVRYPQHMFVSYTRYSTREMEIFNELKKMCC